jgi:hypothetical protein
MLETYTITHQDKKYQGLRGYLAQQPALSPQVETILQLVDEFTD